MRRRRKALPEVDQEPVGIQERAERIPEAREAEADNADASVNPTTPSFLLILTPSLRLRSQGHAGINRSSEERDAMRPKARTLTPGLSSRQKGAGAEHVPPRKGIMKTGGGATPGPAPDVPHEPG
jgi:hypothetical protein